jgi:hypothetical protein
MNKVTTAVARFVATGALALAGVVAVPLVASATTDVSASLSTVTASASTVAANGASTVTITVGVVATSGVPATSGGDVVTIATSAGRVSAVTDAANGSYVATVTAPASPAVATVSATVNGVALSATATVTFGAGVTYNALGGTGAPVDATVYATGAPVTILFSPAPTKSGRYFLGWVRGDTSDPYLVTAPAPVTFAFPGKPVTLYAVWSKRALTTVTLTDPAGTPLATPATVSVSANSTYQIHVVTNAAAPLVYQSAPQRTCTVSTTGLVTITSGKQCNVLVRAVTTETTFPSAAVLKLTITTTDQAPLVITSTTGTRGTPLAITTTGGSGTGAVYVGVVGHGSARCFTLDHLSVIALRPGTCPVVAMKLASGPYAAAYSPVTTLTFN